jgi:hypothetical protein
VLVDGDEPVIGISRALSSVSDPVKASFLIQETPDEGLAHAVTSHAVVRVLGNIPP